MRRIQKHGLDELETGITRITRRIYITRIQKHQLNELSGKKNIIYYTDLETRITRIGVKKAVIILFLRHFPAVAAQKIFNMHSLLSFQLNFL